MSKENESPNPTPPVETPAPAPTQPAATPPLYKGLTGELKTTDELKAYTASLEAEVLKTRPAPTPAPIPELVPPPPQAPKKQTFEDLVYTDPEKAKQALLSEFEERQTAAKAQEDDRKEFFREFYSKNPDLKDLDQVVQSVVKGKAQTIYGLKTRVEVAEFLAKESRLIVDSVKRRFGVTETELESRSAVTLEGGSADPFSAGSAAPAPAKVVNMADQLAQFRRKKK